MENLNSTFTEFLQGKDFGQFFNDTLGFLGIKPEFLGIGIGDSMEFSLNDVIEQCDIAGFDFEQLAEMGMDDQDVVMLSLGYTGIHYVLDNIPEFSDLSDVQKKYTENFMTGVAATVHEIDLSQMDATVDAAHIYDIKAIHDGEQFAQDYIDKYGDVPSFEDCNKHIEDISRHSNVSFKGYTQSEIDSKYHKAESDYSHAQADYRRHMDLAKTGTMPNNDELAHAREAQRRMEAAQKEMSKWKYTHPDKK